jgi:hypothetical protein
MSIPSPLSAEQSSLLESWMPGHEAVENLSWDSSAANVLRIRFQAQDFIVKAARTKTHHIGREIAAYMEWHDGLAEMGGTPRLVHPDSEQQIIVLTYLEGELVEGNDAEWDESTYVQPSR